MGNPVITPEDFKKLDIKKEGYTDRPGKKGEQATNFESADQLFIQWYEPANDENDKRVTAISTVISNKLIDAGYGGNIAGGVQRGETQNGKSASNHYHLVFIMTDSSTSVDMNKLKNSLLNIKQEEIDKILKSMPNSEMPVQLEESKNLVPQGKDELARIVSSLASYGNQPNKEQTALNVPLKKQIILG